MTSHTPTRARFDTVDYSEDLVMPLVVVPNRASRRDAASTALPASVTVDRQAPVRGLRTRKLPELPELPSLPTMSALVREQQAKERIERRIVSLKRRAAALVVAAFALGLLVRTPIVLAHLSAVWHAVTAFAR